MVDGDWTLLEYRPGRYVKITHRGAVLGKATEAEVRAWFVAERWRAVLPVELESAPSLASLPPFAPPPETPKPVPEPSSANAAAPEPPTPPPVSEHPPQEPEEPALGKDEDSVPPVPSPAGRAPVEPLAPGGVQGPAPEVEEAMLVAEETVAAPAASAPAAPVPAEALALEPEEPILVAEDEDAAPASLSSATPAPAEVPALRSEEQSPAPEAELAALAPSQLALLIPAPDDFSGEAEADPVTVVAGMEAEEAAAEPPAAFPWPGLGTLEAPDSIPVREPEPMLDEWQTSSSNLEDWLWVDARPGSSSEPGATDLAASVRWAMGRFENKPWTGGRKPGRLQVHPDLLARGVVAMAEALGLVVVTDPTVTPGTFRLGLAEEDGSPRS